MFTKTKDCERRFNEAEVDVMFKTDMTRSDTGGRRSLTPLHLYAWVPFLFFKRRVTTYRKNTLFCSKMTPI